MRMCLCECKRTETFSVTWIDKLSFFKKNFLISHETFTKYFFYLFTLSFIRNSRTEVIVVDNFFFFEDCY